MTSDPAPKVAAGGKFAFTNHDFKRICALIHARAGIALADGKQGMVYSRLTRRLRALGMASFDDYLNELEAGHGQQEWQEFTNALTTNLTSFFREAHHFSILAEHARKVKKPVEIWCAGASTGEEPYSIAMTACEAFDSLTPPVNIIATDIDTRVLEIADRGVYAVERLNKITPERLKRFFLRGTGLQEGQARVRPELRSLISFRQLNLLAPEWPLRGRRDAIFCRNVMIYFDKPTQARLLERFAAMLKPDGLLFAGHSENFMHMTREFRLCGKTIYQRDLSGGRNAPAVRI